LDLIPSRVSAPRLSPLSLTLSFWTCSYLPPPHFASPHPSPFFNAAFPRPRDGAAASSCAAANYDPARESEDNNDDDNYYAWGEEGHCRNHPGSDDCGNSPERWQNRLKTLPSMGDPAVADSQRPPPPPVDRPPGGHNRNAGDGANNNELARFARLLRSKHDPPLNVTAVDEDGNCLFHVVLLQVYGDTSGARRGEEEVP
jgi:hypothetical protein